MYSEGWGREGLERLECELGGCDVLGWGNEHLAIVFFFSGSTSRKFT